MKQQLVFIGDIHSCLTEFEELVNLIKIKCPNPRIICLGDFLDRADFPVECIRFAREKHIESVLGNHEALFLKWLKNKDQKHPTYYEQFSKLDIEYIQNMPLYIELDNVIAVHAGIKPNIPMNKQAIDDLLYLRYTDSNRKFISLKQINKSGKEALGARFWTEFGPFGKDIVYGHHVHSLTDINIVKYDDGTSIYGIDGGCCFGGNLNAFLYDTKEVIQVKAKKEYFQSTFNIR
jgi:serine/threonine protein phosphatase 1